MAKKKAKNEEKKPVKKLSVKEAEEKVLELAKKDTPLSRIGLILKQEFGIPKAKYTIGKIRKLLEKNKIKQFPEELTNLINKAAKLREHFTKNHKDQVSKRGLQITEAKVRKLASYFKKKGVLEKNWTYTRK